MNHEPASNAHKSVKSLDCRIRLERPGATILCNKHVAFRSAFGIETQSYRR